MRRTLILFLLACIPSIVKAQATFSNPLGGNLTVQDAGICLTTGSFLWQHLPSNAATTTVNLAGTFSGTLTIRLSNNGGGSWTTNNTTTSSGTTSIGTNGFTDICADVTTFTSGSFGVTITTGLNTGPQGPPGPAGSISNAGGGAVDNTINPIQAAYGAKWDVKALPNCSWTSGGTTVTCTDAPFSSNDCQIGTGCTGAVNKIMFGTCSVAQVNINAPSNALDLAQGTITGFTSTSVVTVSSTAGATCPRANLPNGNFAWGTQDDTAAIQAAENAAWNTVGTCKALQLPAGFAFIKLDNGLFNGPVGNACATASGTAAFSDLISVGPEVYGQGQQISKLIILPSSVFTGCTFGSASSSCMGTAPNLQAHDFSIDGLQNPVGGTHANILWESTGANGGGGCDGGSTLWNMAFAGFGLTSTSLIGVQIGFQSCNDPYFANTNVTMFGQQPCSYKVENILSINAFLCFGSGTFSAGLSQGGQAAGAHVLNSYGSSFYSSLVTANQVFRTTGSGAVVFNSYGDHFLNANVTGTQFALLRLDAPTTINFFSSTLALPSSTNATTILLWSNNAANVIRARDSIFTATGTNNQLFLTTAGDKFFDEGGNTFTPGTVSSTFNGAAFGFTNSASGTACATGNFALTSGWGTSSVASVAANGNILGCHVSITGAAGSAGPTLTWTYPAAPAATPASCHISGGAFGTLTGAQSGAPGATSVLFTFTGTPSAQTYTFDVGCP